MRKLSSIVADGKSYLNIFSFLGIVLLSVVILAVFFVLRRSVSREFPTEALIFLYLMLLGSLFFLYFAYVKRMAAKRIAEASNSSISDIEAGRSYVEGEVISSPQKETFKSPITRRDCVFYNYIVRERMKASRMPPRAISTERKDSYLFLEDGTDKILLDTENADINVSRSLYRKVTNPSNIDRYIREFNRRQNLDDWSGNLFNGTLRIYEEKIIEPGESIYVYGNVSKEKHNSEAVKVINSESSDDFFLITDRSQDKVVGMKNKYAAILLLTSLTGLFISTLGFSLIFGLF